MILTKFDSKKIETEIQDLKKRTQQLEHMMLGVKLQENQYKDKPEDVVSNWFDSVWGKCFQGGIGHKFLVGTTKRFYQKKALLHSSNKSSWIEYLLGAKSDSSSIDWPDHWCIKPQFYADCKPSTEVLDACTVIGIELYISTEALGEIWGN